jgi:hypothetical protein
MGWWGAIGATESLQVYADSKAVHANKEVLNSHYKRVCISSNIQDRDLRRRRPVTMTQLTWSNS